MPGVNLFGSSGDKADRSQAARPGAASLAASDRELVDRVAKGDRAALRLLFMRHHARVYRFVVRQTGSEMVADDVANEVFLELWKQAPGFEGRSEVSTWLLGIARFKALSALRKRKEEQIDDDEAAAVPDDSDTPEVLAMKEDKSAALRRMIDALPQEHRIVIDLAYYHGKSVTEIGEVLDIPVATVKTRMFYARKKLGEALKAAGYDRGWP
jgi:RNA polymerase sigma-70 factor (ECF subfamily)